MWGAPSWGRVVGEFLVFFAEEVDEHGGVGHVEHTVVVEIAYFQSHVAITQTTAHTDSTDSTRKI